LSPPRFFVAAALAVGERVLLAPAVAHHALRVLRLRAGERITLFNGGGGEFGGQLRLEGQAAAAQIDAFDPVERESPLALTLVQSWVGSDKVDWIVAKAVELGAAAIVLAPAERSVVRLAGERLRRRLAHLSQLAIAACEQCGRNRLPAVQAADSLAGALATATDLRLILLPGAPALVAQSAADAPAARSIAVAVGPEGGFTDHEVALAQRSGWTPAALGPRVLRTETAGVVALAALQALAGDLSAPRVGGRPDCGSGVGRCGR